MNDRHDSTRPPQEEASLPPRGIPPAQPPDTRVDGSGTRSHEGLLDDAPCRTVKEAKRRYGPFIMSSRIPANLPREERERVYCNVFVRLFKRSLGPSGMPDRVLSTLCGFVTDELKNLAAERKRWRKRFDGEPSEELPAPSSANPERLLGREEERAEREREVREIFGEMDSEDVELLKLSHWEDLTSKDIGELLGIKPANVRQRLSRARAEFAKLLKKKRAQEGEDS
jgi:RNA polymerase sigma factor (sigma-70 family)